MRLFVDRGDAGRQLAQRLASIRSAPRLIVLGLPRGGVPVAFEVAQALEAPLDVFVVRKLGVPGHEELAMGALAMGGVRVLDGALIRRLGIRPEEVEAITLREGEELARRVAAYRGQRPLPELRGATVVVVDDGVATGASMLSALEGIRAMGPGQLVAAAPVISVPAARRLAAVADSCVSIATPEPFGAVGAFYEDFGQTTDAEVRRLLFDATQPRPGATMGREHAARP